MLWCLLKTASYVSAKTEQRHMSGTSTPEDKDRNKGNVPTIAEAPVVEAEGEETDLALDGLWTKSGH